MGNLCPWCKNTDDAQSADNPDRDSARTNSQRSLISSEVNDRTPLLSKSGSYSQHNHTVPPPTLNAPTSIEPSSFLANTAPPLPPPFLHENSNDFSTERVPSNDNADASMANIVERMLPALIDVGGWGAVSNQTNTNLPNSNKQNDHLKQVLCKSLQAIRPSTLPDAGASHLSSLLSSRPISADICHYMTQTASELSRLLIEEIKIIHKEDLVVTFE